MEKYSDDGSEFKTEKPSDLQVPLQPILPDSKVPSSQTPQRVQALGPTSPIPPPTYVAQMSNSIKVYSGEAKHEGTGDSIDHKLTNFHHLCDLTGVAREASARALAVMLSRFAKEHYLAANPSYLTFEQAANHLRNFFEGPGYNRRNLGTWNGSSLKLIVSQNKAKPTSECLQIMVQTLREIQHGLTEDLGINSFMHDKIITAFKGVPACR